MAVPKKMEKKREAIFEEEHRRNCGAYRSVDGEEMKTFRLDLINAMWLLPTKRLKELLDINERIKKQYEKEIEAHERLAIMIEEGRASCDEIIRYSHDERNVLMREAMKAVNAIQIITRLIALSE